MGEKAISQGAIVAAPGASAAAMAWRFRGELHVTVVAKAAFAFATDAPMNRAAPRPIQWDEVHHGNHPARSIRLSPDMVPRLGRADVLFTGHAHLPPTAPGEAAPVRIGIFDGSTPRLAKTVLVRRKGTAQGPIPLVYERAYGGIGWADNPFGVGAAGASGEPEILSASDPKQTAGLGPISRAWPQRRKLASNLPKDALRAAIVNLPDPFSWEYFQAAPLDQQIPFLKGDEWIVLDSLHPTTPRLRMRLPIVRGMARVTGLPMVGGADAMMLDLVLDQLHIDGDERVVTATLRSSFVLSPEDALPELRIVAGVASQMDPIQWPVEEEEAPESSPFEKTVALPSNTVTSRRSGEVTIILEDDDIVPVSLEAVSVDPESVEAMTMKPAQTPPARGVATTIAETFERAPDLPAAALPFKPATAPSPLQQPGFGAPSRDVRPPPPPADDDENPFAGTMALSNADFASLTENKVLPFAQAEAPAFVPTMKAPAPASARAPQVNVPVAAPVNVPVAAPTNVPVQEPVHTPAPAASAPVKAPVNTPVAQPVAAPAKSGSPWAEPAEPAPAAPVPKPQKPAGPPAPAANLKRGLYSRFGKP